MCEDIAYTSDCDTEHYSEPGRFSTTHESLRVSFDVDEELDDLLEFSTTNFDHLDSLIDSP